MNWGLFWTIALAITIGPVLVGWGISLFPIVLIIGIPLIILGIIFIFGIAFWDQIIPYVAIIVFLVIAALILDAINKRYLEWKKKHVRVVDLLEKIRKIASILFASLVFYIIPLIMLPLILLSENLDNEKTMIAGMVALLPIGATIFQLFMKREIKK